MSFRQKAAALGAAAAALLILFVLGEVFSPRRAAQAGSDALLFPGFQGKSAQRIELAGSASRTLLVHGQDWTIEDGGRSFPAAQAKVGFLLGAVGGLRRGALVTRNPDRAAELGVSGSTAVRLLVSGPKGEPVCEMTAGRTAATGRGVYLRPGKGPEIYETGEALSPYLSTERRFWADLRVLPAGLAPEAVIRISVRSRLALAGGKDARRFDYTLTRGQASGKPAWTFAGGGQAADDKVKRLLEAVLALEGNDFDTAADAPARINSGAQAVVTLSFSDNRDLSLSVAAGIEGGQFPCALSGGAYAYLAPEWRVDQILTGPQSLMPPQR